MNIITGYRNEPHYTQQQMRDENMSIYGSGVYILNIGSQMAATIVSANEIRIADGLVVAQGCTAEVERGTTESIAVDNGEQGMLRKDLIVLRYTRNAMTNVEDMELDIIKGTPASSNPATPSYTSGSIADGDTLVEFPLYTVNISGITIQSVTRMVDYVTIANKSYVDSVKTTLQNAINAVSNTLTTVSNRVGTATLNTTAKNALAAINELLTRINTLTSNLATTNSNVTAANTRINTANSNITAVANRTTALETKTAGIVKTLTYDIAASANNYKQLAAGGSYLLILNADTISNAVRGIYQIGTSGGKALGIKTISAASIAEVTDGGSGLLKVHNTGSITLKATLITFYG